VPHFQMHLFDETLDGTVEQGLVAGLTAAIAEVYGDDFAQLAVVELIGVPRHRWGVGGRTATDEAPVIELILREGAFSLPHVPDAEARLIAAITAGVGSVLGAGVAGRTTVQLTGVPRGRSGVGGVAA